MSATCSQHRCNLADESRYKAEADSMNAHEQVTHCNAVTLLFFEVDHCALYAKELEVLTEWLSAWRTRQKGERLIVGGALETPRAGRLRRLQSILKVLEAAGVTSRMMHPLDLWSMPARMGLAESLPADVAWIGCGDPTAVTAARNKLQSHTGVSGLMV